MKKPTRKEFRVYEDQVKLNSMFRDVDRTLAGALPPEQRVVVMNLIWPEVQNIASAVMRRVLNDISRG